MADIPIQLDVTRTERQRQAWDLLADPAIRRVLYGGAKGGGKSFFLCVWAFVQAYSLISRFSITESKNPLHVGWIGRKQATDFTATTLQTWRQTIPEQYYELKSGTEKDSKHILIMGRVAIDYGGLDRQENINKFNSAEYSFFAIDQAEETSRDDVSVLQGSLRLTIDGQALDYKELYTANPANCWLKSEFINEKKPSNVFVPALPGDNPHLPAGYVDTLKGAFGHRKELLEAYLYGNWTTLEGANQVILGSWIQTAKTIPSLMMGKVISCDVARFGDDKTVIMVLDGTEIVETVEMGYCRTTEISDRIVELSRRHNNIPIVVDEIGVGGGVIDQLRKYGRRVMPFNSSNKAYDPEKFFNLRAEAWWEMSEHFSRAEIGCSKMPTELENELTSVCYEFRNGRILIESKDDIKSRLKHSPDYADCYVMGVWAVKRERPAIQVAHAGKESPYSNNILKRGIRRTA